MRFWDEVTVFVRGGKGGNGIVGWRREALLPRGGPDGGDGGNGGAVIFLCSDNENTLVDFSFQPHLFAQDGEAGSGNDCHGRDGENLICEVPAGCQVYFRDQLVADLSVPGARWIAARGGRGGKGNAFFKSSTRQSPDFAQDGRPGDEVQLRLVLKSVADVGLIGLPNTGKSTLISTISSARPKIADYPFTTLVPQLGVVTSDANVRFVVCDIPGLIPGAHEGKGLGREFLKHVERTKVLVHLIDLTQSAALQSEDIPPDETLAEIARAQFESIDTELRLFSEDLMKLPRIVVFSKVDIEANQRAFHACREDFQARGLETMAISSASGAGIGELTKRLAELVLAWRAAKAAEKSAEKRA
ncbi:MAG: GTPase ObgE [Deltaproteobacteria bacterium]|nr:GTPase ObgE [Deltaproteobacteria bacterium]